MAQFSFEGVEVTEYENTAEGWLRIKEGHYRYALDGKTFHKIGHFDEVNKILEEHNKKIIFVCKKPESQVFEESYKKLVSLFGQEKVNKDSGIEDYNSPDELKKAVKKGKAGFYREWQVRKEDSNFDVVLLWQKKDLEVIFTQIAKPD